MNKKHVISKQQQTKRSNKNFMSQIDLSSYSSTIIWGSITFIYGYIYIYSFNLPNFIFKTQIKNKIKNMNFFNIFIKSYKIKINNNFYLIIKTKVFLKICDKVKYLSN